MFESEHTVANASLSRGARGSPSGVQRQSPWWGSWKFFVQLNIQKTTEKIDSKMYLRMKKWVKQHCVPQ